MSKKTKPAVSYAHVTPQLVSRVHAVIADADKHKYSVSRVYGAHNEAFQKRDQPQTCSSCLRNRVRELRAWLRDYDGVTPTATTGVPVTVQGVLARLGMTFDGDDSERLAIEAALQAGDLTEDERAVLDVRAEELIPVLPYDGLVKRLGLVLGDTPAEELATLNTVIEPGYPWELTDEETDAVLTRMGELEELVKTEAQYDDPGAPGFVAPAQGVTRYPMGEGVIPFDFTPSAEEPNKGTVAYADGSKVKAGTYTTASGHEIAVQPGGKASIKEVDLT